MAFWVRGGGEQPLCLSDGEEGRRPYYVDDEVHQSAHPLRHEQVFAANDSDDDRYLRGTYSNGPFEGQKQHHFMIRRGPQHQDWPVYRHQIPECDVPYQSIESEDTDATDVPAFFVIHEESFNTSSVRRSLTPQSPYPVRDGYSPSPAPTNWSNGSGRRAFTANDSYGPDGPDAARIFKLQRYEDWRDQNRQYGMSEEQLENSRSFSPILIRPRKSSRRQTPDGRVLRQCAHHLHDAWHKAHDLNAAEVVHNVYHRNHHEQDQYGHESDPYMVESLSCPVQDHGAHNPTEPMMTDSEAAASVTSHLAEFNRRCPSSRHERILLGLIHPKSVNAEFELDSSALESIFSAANEVFFNGRLTGRVQWDWSDANSNPQYDNKIIGHTSLRRAQMGGFETFILLSTPILRSREYSRRLLISAFLHELIHCYLFICCGWSARESGGHTDGFRYIADTIDQWAGRENLFLCQVEADLERFRRPPERNLAADAIPAEDYSGYSLASPVFYNAHLCSSNDTDWERSVHDCWERRHGGDDGHPGHFYTWP
ncbi:hypothetical protein SEUCBS140593_000148 [Sporothrix eucalyptigena]|uniref:SprT-like domain-containing protein n=1 Tax=Sporothrix eucalyptigena TaxID=1812306 RepID=A0ABP0AKL3_9PEZI